MSKSSNFIFGFALGVGAVFAVSKFLTSRTGLQVQDKLREVSDDLRDRASDYYAFADSTARDVKDSATDKWDEFSDRFSSAKDAAAAAADTDDDSVVELEFDLDDNGTMHPTSSKDDVSEFQQATGNDQKK